MVRPPAVCWFLVLTVLWLVIYLWLPVIKKQRIPVGFWRLVWSVRVIGRRSNYLWLWGLSNFANLISLETFGCIEQPFFRNLLTLLNLHKLSSAAILSRAGNLLLNSAFHLHADPEPASRTTYAVLMSSKKSKRAVYGWNPALFKFYQCRIDVLQSQIFLRSQISLAAMLVITDFCWYSSILASLHFCSTESM